MTAIQAFLRGGGVIYFYINVELISTTQLVVAMTILCKGWGLNPRLLAFPYIFKMCELQPLDYLIK